jgi:DNA invertase Pin-like site-specific DNA recombinase
LSGFLGVLIQYVLGVYPDTPEGNFMRHIRATVAEYEREKINERVIRDRYSKVKVGSVLVSGHAPFGYKVVQDNNQYRFEIQETEAEVVRMIYSLYLGDLSARKIAARLSELGIPSYTDNRPNYRKWLGQKRRAEGTWSLSSVHCILKCETYAGIWRYGKNIGRGGK